MKTRLSAFYTVLFLVYVFIGFFSNNAIAQNQDYFYVDDPEARLLMAVYDQDMQEVKQLVEDGVNVNAKDYEGISALGYAVMGEDDQIAWYLISKGANVKIRDYSRRTILMHAILENREHWVSELLPLIDSINHQDIYGYTALIYACQNGNIETIMQLVEAGADIHILTQTKTSALMHAVAYGHFHVVDYLIEMGADVNHQSADGSSSLHLAAWYSQYEIAGLLIDWGADMELQDKKGNTPLLLAVINNQPYMVWYLIESGASPEAVNDEGKTAITIASSLKRKEIMDLLLQYDYQEPAAAGKRQSALAYAYYNRNYNLVRELIATRNLKPTGLYFSELWLQQGFDFNGDDLMYNTGISVFEARYKWLVSFNYLTRIGHKKLIATHLNDDIYQFHEKRRTVNLSFAREFELFSSISGFKSGLLAGLEGRYTFARYKGTGYEPPGGYGFGPVASMYAHWKSITIMIGYNYFNTGQGQISPHRYRATISIRIPFYKKSSGSDYIPQIK